MSNCQRSSAGIAVDDPVGQRLAGAAGGGDAGGEAAGDVEIVEFRREADDRLAVGGDRDRPVDDRLDADLVEERQPLRRRQREEFEPIHVGREKLAGEVEGRPPAPAALGAVLPAADGEGADIGLEVEILVGIAQRRQPGVEGERLLGDEILVLDDAGGERDAGHLGDALRPDAGAVDQDIAADRAVIGDDADRAAAFADDIGDADALLDADAAGPRAGGEGVGQAVGST